MHLVRGVRYVAGYELLLTFENGAVRRANLEPYLQGEVFEPLRDLQYFKDVRLDPEIDTIVWENGADFSPDFLYEIGECVPVEEANRER